MMTTKKPLSDGAKDAMDAVFHNADLLKLILLGNISPSNFCLLRRTCKSIKALLDTDDEILRAVPLYCGNLLKNEMRSFFSLERTALESLPCTKVKNFVLYNKAAFDRVTGKGCAKELAKRRSSVAGQRLRALEEQWRLRGGQQLPSVATRSQSEEVKARKFGVRKIAGKVNREKLVPLVRSSYEAKVSPFDVPIDHLVRYAAVYRPPPSALCM